MNILKPTLKVTPYVAIIVLFSFVLHTKLKTPSNNKNWVEGFKQQSQISISNNNYTFTNIYNWQYTKDQIVKKQVDTSTYDINDLQQVWFVLQPFDYYKGFAHSYLVFDFKDNKPLALSIEARREKGETYGVVKGALNNFELIYKWGYETDITVGRIVYYKNSIYMYPLNISKPAQKQLFIDLVNKTNTLNQNAEFYNTFTHNCTNSLAQSANRVSKNTIPLHYSYWLTGFSDNYLQRLNLIPTKSEKYNITDFVNSNYTSLDFSQKLRDFLKN